MPKIYNIISQLGRANVNIVFVHGLGGHATSTWMTAQEEFSTFWPLWIPELVQGANVWSVAYDAPPTDWLGRSLPIEEQSKLLIELMHTTEDLTRAPIIYICHSLGGIIIKNMHKISTENSHLNDIMYSSFLNKTIGVIFLGTPHRGSNYAKVAVWIRAIFSPSIACQELTNKSSNLLNLNSWFVNWKRRPACISFYEKQNTWFPPIVDYQSSDPNIPGELGNPIDGDHFEVCKYTNRQSASYKRIIDFINNNTDTIKTIPGNYICSINNIKQNKTNNYVHLVIRAAILIFSAFLFYTSVSQLINFFN